MKTLLDRGIIAEPMVELLLSWRHPGFSVYQGQPVQPEDTRGRERLARYILHAPFSHERITYDRSTKTIACESKKNTRDGVTVVPALDWLAGLVTAPGGQHWVRRMVGKVLDRDLGTGYSIP